MNVDSQAISKENVYMRADEKEKENAKAAEGRFV